MSTDQPFDWPKSSTTKPSEAKSPAVVKSADEDSKPATPHEKRVRMAIAAGASKLFAVSMLKKLEDHPEKLKTLDTAPDTATFRQRWYNLKRWLAAQKPT